MKQGLFARLALPKTALWMGASRFGPIAAGFMAAATLPTSEYSKYVVALAWLGGLVSVLASATQALAARAGEQPLEGERIGDGFKGRSILGMVLLVPALLASVFLLLGYPGPFVVALSIAGLVWSTNAVLASLLWGEGKTGRLSIASLLESGLMIIGVALAGVSFGSATAVFCALFLASVLASIAYVISLGGIAKIEDLVRQWNGSTKAWSKSGSKRPDGIMTPSLVNGAFAAAGPAIALGVASGRDPESAAVYGLIMLFVAGCLFPLQILGIAAARPLVASDSKDRLRLGGLTLLIAAGWGIGIAIGLVLLGPKVGPLITGDLKLEVAYLLGGGILLCFSPVVIAGPIVQAERRYWAWAITSVISCLFFVISAYALPIGPELALQACLISAVVRLFLALPLAGFIVTRWHRQT